MSVLPRNEYAPSASLLRELSKSGERSPTPYRELQVHSRLGLLRIQSSCEVHVALLPIADTQQYLPSVPSADSPINPVPKKTVLGLQKYHYV